MNACPRAVARYIRSLKAVTLTRDTRVTSHSSVNGRAVGYQAILQAGTAVLVDEALRAGRALPLRQPAAQADLHRGREVLPVPPDYRLPPPCRYLDFEDPTSRG